MVVRTAQRIVPRPMRTRAVDGVAAVIMRGLGPFDTSQRSIRNALAASVELSSAATERRQVEAFLTDYASVRNARERQAQRAS